MSSPEAVSFGPLKESEEAYKHSTGYSSSQHLKNYLNEHSGDGASVAEVAEQHHEVPGGGGAHDVEVHDAVREVRDSLT